MTTHYKYNITISNFNDFGYLKVVADINDKHDRSAPSNYHWKVLKCRMIIFSASTILACPDKSDVKQIHVIFNKVGSDYDHLTSLFLKFSLTPDGNIHDVTSEIYQLCFQYTMSAKMAPTWNVLGSNHFINNRNFLTASGPQHGIQCIITIMNDFTLILELKPVKIHILRREEKYLAGENIRVLPSLNRATIEDNYDHLPKSTFNCYKDLRRHWKNIHGYRLPEGEHSPCYYMVRFWRGDPLTYPAICLTRDFPIITPMPKPAGQLILTNFIDCLINRMPNPLGIALNIEANAEKKMENINNNGTVTETQGVSLCTPTQNQHRK